MLLNFRQGIVSAQTLPHYIQYKNGNVALDTSKQSIVITFAHGAANYLYTETSALNAAWRGPFNSNSSYWLYWEISLVTGRRSFGYSTAPPSYGTIFPSSPQINEHFFDTSNMKMYSWNGHAWGPVVRVFAGSLINGQIRTTALGTQVNSNVQNSSGKILFDIYNQPLKRYMNDGSFEFLTDGTIVQPIGTNLESIKMSQLDISGVSKVEIVPKYWCVISDGKDIFGNVYVRKASYFDVNNPAFAITSSVMNPSEVRQLVRYGYLQDPRWYWDYPPLTPLFVGGGGEISTYVKNPYSSQRIGYIVNLNTIFIDIQRQIIFVANSPYVSPTPSITPTISVTPTITPTLSLTPTVTPTLTATMTPTMTLTPTATVTPSPTLTPTITATPEVTLTPTMTPSITPTNTITPTLTRTPTVTPTIPAGPSFSDNIFTLKELDHFNMIDTNGDVDVINGQYGPPGLGGFNTLLYMDGSTFDYASTGYCLAPGNVATRLEITLPDPLPSQMEYLDLYIEGETDTGWQSETVSFAIGESGSKYTTNNYLDVQLIELQYEDYPSPTILVPSTMQLAVGFEE